MAEHFGGVDPADLAFNPDYWGEIMPAMRDSVPYRHVGRAERKYANERLGYYVPRVARGQAHGVTVSPGVTFDPYDNEAASYAPHCYHGAVILVDLEGILPPGTPGIWAPEEPEHRDVMSVPIHKLLLRNRSEIVPPEQMNGVSIKSYMNMRETFSNEAGEIYFREAIVITIARAAGGGMVPLASVGAAEGSRNGALLNSRSSSMKATATTATTRVGETFAQYDSQGEPKSVRRIREISIIAQGTKTEVRSRIFSFAGRTANS